MLFTARPPLPYLKPPQKPKCRNIDSIINSVVDYLDKFEDMEEVKEYHPPLSAK